MLTDKLSLTRGILPCTQEQLSQERVQRLLLGSELLVSGGILLLERGKEPLQHKHGPLLRVLLQRGGDKDVRHLCPVRAELGEGCCTENKSGCSHGRKVAVERCHRLKRDMMVSDECTYAQGTERNTPSRTKSMNPCYRREHLLPHLWTKTWPNVLIWVGRCFGGLCRQCRRAWYTERGVSIRCNRPLNVNHRFSGTSTISSKSNVCAARR